MAIPPFPSHDLAKLILGYLAEEQLMTAYDEFLQASPYLDVLSNEYDRIFMTSLKNILAEYRAVKIYVETCKPFFLRKKLFQCPNLLEVFKFLVNHIDISRLNVQETSCEKSSYNRQTSYMKIVCEVCSFNNLSTCVCKAKAGKLPTIHPTSQIEASSIASSIETTSLADLPGNSITKKNSNTELAAEVAHPQSRLVEQTADIAAKGHNVLSSTSVVPHFSSGQNLQNNASLAFIAQDISSVKSAESKQKIEEFNTIFNLVCSNNNSTNSRRSNFVPENSTNKTICSAGGFQQFAAGVTENTNKERPIVPDSSTSENINAQTTASKQNRKIVNPIISIQNPPIAQFLPKPETMKNQYLPVNKDLNSDTKAISFVKIKEKPEQHKITILSDVKVDNAFRSNNCMKVPPVLRANASSPMLQMQTIVINGTPAYRHKQQTGTNFSYTKDEIMAMPTIIVVPSSAPSQNLSAPCSQSNITPKPNTTTTKSPSLILGPLVIDVSSSNSPSPVSTSHNLPKLIPEDLSKLVSEGLVKTVDTTVHGSLPKDANLTVPNKTSTPNALPPTRKSSSTPRRNSHVRVLDFATPRRILHETMKECDPNPALLSIENGNNGAEINTLDVPVHKTVLINDKRDSNNKGENVSTEENKSKTKKKGNWDAELRAAIAGTVVYEESVISPKPKHKKKKSKKVSPVTENVSESPGEVNTKKTSILVRVKKLKKKKKSIEDVQESMKVLIKNPVSEPHNIVSEREMNAPELPSTDKNQIKMNISDDYVDTPEAERLSLQNLIDAKLNISELLETPYKQALYDIQMETPKFLGNDLPDEPISDIKIMSIPTPLYLNTAKPMQATPSSYSSRPTDYSSGGSYYKPDDQDFIPSSDLQSVASLVEDKGKSTNKEVISIEDSKKKEKPEKPSRPQRKCTRNVSYTNSSICKIKDDEMLELASVSSETSNKSIKDKKHNKDTDSKTCLKSRASSNSNKRIVAYKSPHKPTNFMKMKTRKSAPMKESCSKGRKKTSGTPENTSRKRKPSKDVNTNIPPVIVPVPTKSRRKSSTPRKINCTKSFNSENAQAIANPNLLISEQHILKETDVCHLHDSENEQQPLIWSDDGSQDVKSKEEQPTSSSLPDEDDITKIKEYIETSALPRFVPDNNSEGSLHIDLIKRGFDVETAKIIERDLLDATPIQDTAIQSTSNEDGNVKKIEVSVTLSDRVESDSSTANNLQIIQEDTEIDEIELSACECNDESENYVMYQFDETQFVPSNDVFKLRDKFSMELCIDDDVTIRLRAAPFKSLFDIDPKDLTNEYDDRETEDAVNSISNFDKLYTPMKDRRTQCFEIFDSTLTSIDTPLKSDGPRESKYVSKVAEIVLEVESIDVKEKNEGKRRKRLQSGSLEESLSKKSKPETQYLLNSANIQNIDIESVLSKLHGP